MSDRLKLILFLLLALWLRLLWLELPPFQQLNAEESFVGLTARHILKRELPSAGLETYLLSLFFLAFGASASVARFLPLLLSLLSLVSVYCLGKTLFNAQVALRGVLFLAVAPLFLLQQSVTPSSGYWLSLILGPWIILWTYNVLFRKSRITRLGWHYFGIGFLSGVLLWQEPIGLSFLIPSLLLLIFCERKFFLRPSFWLVAIGFGLGILPLLASKQPLEWKMWPLFFSLFPSQEKWQLPFFALLYFPIFLFLFVLIGRTLKSLWQRDKGEWEGSRVLSLYLLSSLAVTLPLLVVFFWSRLERKFPKVAALAFACLIGFNATENFLFARSVWHEPRRPIDAVLAFLNENKITRVVGDSRVVWPIAFESKETIVASAWKEDGASGGGTAYVVEEGDFESILTRLGGTYSIEKIGEQNFFYRVSPPLFAVKEISPEAFVVETALSDGNLSTLESEKMEIELKKPISLRKILLHSGEKSSALPLALEIDISSDGKKWKTIARSPQGTPAVDWRQNQLFFNDQGEFAFYAAEEKVRFLRLTPSSWAEVRIFEENSKAISFSEEERAAAFAQIDRKSIEAVYENARGEVDFSRRNAFLVANDEISFLTAAFKEKEIPFSVEKIKPKFSLILAEPRPWVPSMIWSPQRLFHYFSEEESAAYLQEGDREWNQKRIGLAKKYYAAAFEKFPSPATYACLEKVLQHMHDKEGLKELKSK